MQRVLLHPPTQDMGPEAFGRNMSSASRCVQAAWLLWSLLCCCCCCCLCLLHQILSSASCFLASHSALQGLLRKLGAGFEDILPGMGLSGSRIKVGGRVLSQRVPEVVESVTWLQGLVLGKGSPTHLMQ